MSKIYFVLPAYNEEDNIESVVAQWHPIVEKYGDGGKLVIANDGSKDSTYQKLLLLKQEYPLLQPLDKPNSGHGSTVLFLYNYAIDNGADFIFQTDSDGQTNPAEFEELWRNRNEYSFQIGFRKHRKDGFSRIVVTKTLRFVVFCMFGVRVKDANTPFRLMRSDRLKEILKVVPHDFFLANVAVSAIAVKWKESIRFPKITFKPRQGGVNSINIRRIFKIGIKAFGDFHQINKNLKKHSISRK